MGAISQLVKIIMIALLLLSGTRQVACSMFKVTCHGKTLVGNNEDSWNVFPCMWFENGKKGEYGAVFFGYKDHFPQGGMNNQGLVFDGFSIPARPLKAMPGKKPVPDINGFISGVLKNCKTVDEAKVYIEQYNYGVFPNGMLLFVDRTGKYLVMEPDTLLVGNDSTYVLANFCPSQTKDPGTVKLARYIKGRRYLASKTDTSMGFCRSVMDTMHVCRKRLGDGTLYTSVYDLSEGRIDLYFYHDFSHPLRFSLADELKKGDHTVAIPSLFRANKEFAALQRYQTPLNNRGLFWFLVADLLLFLVSFLFFFIGFIRHLFKNPKSGFTFLRLLPAFISLALAVCCFVIIQDKSIAYLGFNNFTVPAAVASYVPMLLLLALVPLLWSNVLVIRRAAWPKFSVVLFSFDTVACLLFLLAFMYWGLF